MNITICKSESRAQKVYFFSFSKSSTNWGYAYNSFPKQFEFFLNLISGFILHFHNKICCCWRNIDSRYIELKELSTTEKILSYEHKRSCGNQSGALGILTKRQTDHVAYQSVNHQTLLEKLRKYINIFEVSLIKLRNELLMQAILNKSYGFNTAGVFDGIRRFHPLTVKAKHLTSFVSMQ